MTFRKIIVLHIISKDYFVAQQNTATIIQYLAMSTEVHHLVLNQHNKSITEINTDCCVDLTQKNGGRSGTPESIESHTANVCCVGILSTSYRKLCD